MPRNDPATDAHQASTATPLATATATAAAATRIEPVPGPDGQPAELSPPCGGRWLRHADGALSPADASTAQAAGLAWPG